MVEDAMVEEEELKMFKVVQRKMKMMMDKTFSLSPSHRRLQLVRCYLKQERYTINVVSRLLLPLYDGQKGRLS